MSKTKIRSSALPKLAVCGQFEGAQGELSEAAARGMRLDAALRSAWTTGEVPPLEREEGIAVAWSFGVIDGFSKGYEGTTPVRWEVEMREEHCKIWVPLIDYTGTADAICLGGRWIADLKSGQVRNYREQMAAYCLGLMAQHLETEWKYYLIFCDAEEIVSEMLTFAQAREIVQGVIDNLKNPPSENEYCGWCAKSLTCSARVQAKDAAVAAVEQSLAPDSPAFLELLNDPERLGRFLDQCKTFEHFQEAAQNKARETIEGGGDVPGYRLQKGRVTETVSVDTQFKCAGEKQVSYGDLLRAHGAMNAKKFRELVGEGIDFPTETKTSKPSLVSKIKK